MHTRMILAAIQISRILNFLQSNGDEMRVDLICCATNVLSTRLYPLLSIPYCFILTPHFVFSLINSLFKRGNFLLSTLKLGPCDRLLPHHLRYLFCALLDLFVFLSLHPYPLSELGNSRLFLILHLPFLINLKRNVIETLSQTQFLMV
jgi:hypothetical protein